MSRARFFGRKALVTGGGRGLGRALALALAEEGADIALSWHQSREGAESVAQAVRAQGRLAFVAEADARRPGSLATFVDRAAEALGGLDVVVNNAGIFRRVALEDLTEQDLDEALDVNVKAAVMVAKAAAPHLRRRGGGAIVNVASLGGLRPWAAYLPYCASKAALVMATRCLARALAPGIRVNAVAPGVLEPNGAPEAVRERIPQKRFGTLDETVAAVLFLAADATYTTGEVLTLDGGRSLA